jgi:sodium/hydrogen exchanger 8
MFFASAGIGVMFALVSALLLKHVDLRKNPSLEFGMMLVFTYAPYALAEGIHLSGEFQLCEYHHLIAVYFTSYFL